MKKNCFVLVCLLLSSFWGGPAKAEELSAPPVKAVRVENAWVRASNAHTAAVFLELYNDTDIDAFLGMAMSDRCTHTELHDHIQEGHVFRMRPVPRISIPARSQVSLAPGGKHIMLLNLCHPLREGDLVLVTLRYEDGAEDVLQVPVKPLAYQPGAAEASAQCACACPHAPSQKQD